MAMRCFLSREYERRRRRNPRYSLRAFGRDLDTDHSTLSQWMSGVRPMTSRAVDRLLTMLAITGIDRERATSLGPFDQAVIESLRATSVGSSPALAARIGAPVDDINRSLAKLMRLGLLTMNGNVWTVFEGELA